VDEGRDGKVSNRLVYNFQYANLKFCYLTSHTCLLYFKTEIRRFSKIPHNLFTPLLTALMKLK